MPEPIHTSQPDILRAAAAAAVKAPSSYNTQPWRFRIDPPLLEIFADPDRQLHVVDRERRQLIQSCGCALYNARVAVRAMGHEAEVTTILADSVHPQLLATVRIGELRITTDEDHELMRAIDLRHTNRRAFLPWPVTPALSDSLIETARAEGIAMVRLTPDEKQVLGALVDEADRLQYGDPEFRSEVSRWLIPFGARRRDGVPFVEKEFGSPLPFTVERALHSPALGDAVGRIEEDLIAGSPVVFVLGTSDDDPAEWLRCGEALEAVLLRATRLGLSAAFLNQVLEIPGLRGELAALLPAIGYPQMVIRLGVPTEEIRRPAPRRDLDDVLFTA